MHCAISTELQLVNSGVCIGKLAGNGPKMLLFKVTCLRSCKKSLTNRIHTGLKKKTQLNRQIQPDVVGPEPSRLGVKATLNKPWVQD